MEDVSALVAKQYGEWVYPKPISDIEAEIGRGIAQRGDPSINPAMLWPEGVPSRPLRILVAGCGSYQAPWIAFNNPTAHVTGVDLSDASLGFSRALANHHDLQNLDLHKGDLLRGDGLSGQYDLILCTGVLHHLSLPQQGLLVLASHLASDGVIFCALYSDVARSGVYSLQKMFRNMNLSQDRASIDVVREVLALLPSTHPGHSFVRRTKDVEDDGELVDLFLHVQDTAFDVEGILDLASSSGLAFQGWYDNSRYEPEATFSNASPTRARLDALPDRLRWSAVDKIRGVESMHLFMLCHEQRLPSITFSQSDEDWLGYYPVSNRMFVVTERPKKDGEPWVLMREAVSFTCNKMGLELINRANGQRNIREIADAIGMSIGVNISYIDIIKACRNLRNRGHMFISKTQLNPT